MTLPTKDHKIWAPSKTYSPRLWGVKQSQPLFLSVGDNAFRSLTKSFANLQKQGSCFLEKRRFYTYFVWLLLKQTALLKTKITQCRASPTVQSRPRRSESPYRADVSQFSYFAGNSIDSVPSLCSNLLWCGFSIPWVGYFKFSTWKGSSGPPSKACPTNGLRPPKPTHCHRAHFPPDRCLSVLLEVETSIKILIPERKQPPGEVPCWSLPTETPSMYSVNWERASPAHYHKITWAALALDTGMSIYIYMYTS